MRKYSSFVVLAFLALAGGVIAASAPFDYYVLSLSWTPAFCSQPGAAARNPEECAAGRAAGFIVHGLWPESVRGRSPEGCGEAKKLKKAVIDMMLPEMFSPGLIQHEWTTHGNCTGLAAFDYFSLALAARSAVQIPVQLTSADTEQTESPAAIEAQFAEANPGLPREAFRTACRDGLFAEERVCFDKNVRGRACAQSAGECAARQIAIRPPGLSYTK